MSQGKYFGRLKGYSLIIQKKSQLMAYDIMVLIQKNIRGEKKILLLEKKKGLLHLICSLKYAVCFPSNNNKWVKP
jgi:hypothetical protein